MAGYSSSPLPRKLGLKPQFRIAFFQLPTAVRTELKVALSDCLPVTDGKDGSDQLDFAMIFIKSQAQMKEQFSEVCPSPGANRNAVGELAQESLRHSHGPERERRAETRTAGGACRRESLCSG